MGKGSKKRSAFLPPLRNPQNNVNDMVIMKKVQDAYQKKMTEASNNAFNLAVSSCLIASRDMGMSITEVKELLQRTFGILDDVADDLSRIEEILRLVNSWGIDIYDTSAKRTVTSGEVIEKKTAVFYLLQQGTTEIEEILTKCKLHNIDIDYRDACAYRWEFNRKKYYEDMEADMSKREEAFKLLDEGLQNTDLVNKLGISRRTASQYKYLWNKEQEESTMAKNKTKAFKMIKNGATKDDLVKELNITEAAAIRFIDAYHNEKNEGEIEVMTENMKKAFDLFDKAYNDGQVVELLNASKANIANYRVEWVRVNKKDLSTDEMAAILAGDDASIVILRHKGVLPEKKGDKNVAKEEVKGVSHGVKTGKDSKKDGETESSVKKEEGAAPIEVNPEANISREVEPNNQDTSILVGSDDFKYEYREMPNGLKKKVKVVEVAEAIEGEFTTYTPVNEDTFDVELDGQVITLNREAMKVFGKELITVAEAEI